MPTYRFEKQALKHIEIEAEDAESARMHIIINEEDYSMDDDTDYYLSDGVKISD